MKGVILAAGFGTRLWPLTIHKAKPAVPFLNRPLIAYSVEYLYRFGVRQIIINLHHCSESIRHGLEAGLPADVDLHYSEEEQILGTGGALDKVRHRLSDETFAVINGKLVTEVDLNAAMRTHRSNNALATLVLRPNPRRERYTVVETDAGGRIRGFDGFPGPSLEPSTAPPLMFTGIQILEPEMLEYIPRHVFSHTTTEAYPAAIKDGRVVAAHVSEDPWFELSTLSRYLSTSLFFLARSGRTALLGSGCNVDPSARVESSILWDRVRVGPGAALTGCIVGDDCTIPAGSCFERTAIVPSSGHFDEARGRLVGENLVVPIPPEDRG